MALGGGLSISTPILSQGGRDPLTILGASNVKFRYKANVRTSIYTLSLLTINVTADGDPVGGWKDLMGVANQHLKQGTSGKRLKYIASDGGKPAIETDGVDDYLQSAFNGFTQPFTVFSVFKVLSAVSAFDYVWEGNNADKLAFNVGTGPDSSLQAGARLSSGILVCDGVYEAICAVYDNTNAKLYQNNVLRAGGSSGANDPTWGTIGCDPSGAQPAHVRYREIIGFQGTPTGPQRDAMQAYFAGEWGV